MESGFLDILSFSSASVNYFKMNNAGVTLSLTSESSRSWLSEVSLSDNQSDGSQLLVGRFILAARSSFDGQDIDEATKPIVFYEESWKRRWIFSLCDPIGFSPIFGNNLLHEGFFGRPKKTNKFNRPMCHCSSADHAATCWSIEWFCLVSICHLGGPGPMTLYKEVSSLLHLILEL